MADAVVTEDLRGGRGPRLALAGVAFAVLFVVGLVMLRQAPSLSAPAEDLIDFYSDPSRRRWSLVAGLYVIPFAGIAFIWFMAALRARYLQSGGSENLVLSTVQLLTGTLFVVALFVIGSVRVALVLLAEASSPIDPDSARAMVALASAMAEIVGLRAAAVFVAVSATRAVRSGLFPRWYWVVSLVMAAALLLAFAAWPFVSALMPVWVVGTSLFVLSARRSEEAAGPG